MRDPFSALASAIIATMAILMVGKLAAEETAAIDIGPPTPVRETGDEASAKRPSLAALRAAGHRHLEQLNEEQRYEEAAAVALQNLRLAQEEFGGDAQQVIEPLIDLAEAQRNNTNPDAAEQNLSAAVMLIERNFGPLSDKLIGPLTTLGKIYNDSGLFDKAAQTFSRALRLNHINHGFTNFNQLPIMDSLTDSYTYLNDIEEATFYQESQLEIQQRRLGIDDPETAPAYFKLARWYSRTGRYDDAILTYQKADRVVRKALGNDSPERAKGLTGLALVYQQIGNPSTSSSMLRKALKLVEESADNRPFRRVEILVALGDSLTRDGRFSTAQDQYDDAWQTLPDDETGNDWREFYFGEPVRLEGSLFPKYARGARKKPAEKLKTGSILINYSIDAKGRAKDPSIVESYPQGLMDRTFLSIYRKSLFRPLYVDGVATFRDGLLATHEYWYISEETADDSGAIAKPDSSSGKLSYPDND